MDNKIVTARFATDDNYVNVYDVYQWDYGQVLRIEGLKLPNMVEIHFSLQETSGEAKTRIGVTKDGVTDVVIPDSFLENNGIGDNYKIFAWIYIADKDSGSTEYKITIHVKARAKPEITHGGQNGEMFQEAVEAVRDAAARASESEKQAEGWAHGREDLPERAEDNAMYYAGKASEDAQRTAEDRKEVERLTESNTQIQGEVAKDLEEVKKLSSQAQTSATNAALSEQKSKEAATRAETAQTGAETAKNNAELAAQKTGQDKTAVEQAKKLVQQMGQEVLDNKNAVDKTVQDFNLTAQQALADVNNAGQAQTERVQTAGETAVGNIQTAQNTATQAVETTKSEAIKAVQTEGTTQTGNVTAEGEKQVQAVQTAAQEIIADREQIAKNKTDIADLRQKKADAIVESVSGTLLNVKDSSGAFFEDFSMSGKTTQDGTPAPDAPVKIVNAGEDGTIEIKVTGKNLIDEKEIYKTDVNYFISDKRHGGKGIDLKAGTAYTFSVNKNVDGLYIHSYSDIPKELVKVYGQQKLTYTPENDVKVQLLLFRRDKVIKGTTVQLEEGEVATDHETYREPQTITLSSDRPLTKWDKLEKREGVWGIARQGETKVLKAAPEEEWATWEDKQNAFFIMNDKIIKEGLCSHFEAKGSFEIGKETGIYLFDTIHLIVTDINIDSLEDWKTWLQANPIAVAYKIAEETWEPLPEEMQSVLNALHTNYPTTVVTNSEDTEMQLTYVADTKNYYLNREQTIQKQILDIQNALISQKISGGGIKVTNSAKLPIVKLSVFGKSEQVTTTGKNLWGFGDISFKGYKELSVNYPAGNYVLSFGIETEASSNTAQTGICIDGIWKYYQVKKDNRAAIKISSATGITAVRFYAGDSPAVKDNAEYYNIQIEKGADATDYEPYTGGKPSPSPEYPQEITSCGENGSVKIDVTGKNLLNIEGETSEIRGDYEIFDNKITTITKDGYAGSYLMFSEKIPKGKYRFTCNKTKKGVKQNNKVLLSVKAKTNENGAGNSFNSYYKEWLIVGYLKKDILFETFEDFQIGLPLAGDDDKIGDEIIFENVMLMREDLDLTSVYEPYKKIQTFTLFAPNGLLGLKVEENGNYTDETGQQWITDEIDLARGKYVQRIAKYVFDGSEELADNIGSKTSYFLKVNDIRSNTGMCNYGKRIPVTGQKQEELTFCVDDNGIYLYTTKAVNEFKNLLKQKYDSGKPVEVLYALKTPIETDLPPETIAAFKKLHTNYHTTIVSNNADAGMELTYTVDTQSYIDSKIAEVSKALL